MIFARRRINGQLDSHLTQEKTGRLELPEDRTRASSLSQGEAKVEEELEKDGGPRRRLEVEGKVSCPCQDESDKRPIHLDVEGIRFRHSRKPVIRGYIHPGPLHRKRPQGRHCGGVVSGKREKRKA